MQNPRQPLSDCTPPPQRRLPIGDVFPFIYLVNPWWQFRFTCPAVLPKFRLCFTPLFFLSSGLCQRTGIECFTQVTISAPGIDRRGEVTDITFNGRCVKDAGSLNGLNYIESKDDVVKVRVSNVRPGCTRVHR